MPVLTKDGKGPNQIKLEKEGYVHKGTSLEKQIENLKKNLGVGWQRKLNEQTLRRLEKKKKLQTNTVGDGNTKTNGKDAKAEKAELKNANFKAEDNKLHKYASYSYQWTLSSLSQDNIDDWNGNIDSLGQNIIARSAGIGGKDNVVDRRKSGKYGMEAGTGSASIAEVLAARNRRKEDASLETLRDQLDIYFEKVIITGVHTPNPDRKLMNFTKIEMELSEPMGISLYEKLRGAAVANGFRDHLDAPFLLTLDFIGMDTQGKTHKEIPRRYFPIKIVNSEMDMGAGGTMYTVTAVPWTEFGMVNRYLYLRGTATIKGFSITDALKSLETILSSHQRKEKELDYRAVEDEYRFTVDPFFTSQDSPIDNNTMSIFTFNEKGNDGFRGEIHHFGAQRMKKMGRKPQIMVARPNTSISHILERIMLRTRYFRQITRTFTEEYWGKLSEQQKGDVLSKEYVPWFKIVTTVHTEAGNFDSLRKKEKKIIHYHIKPFLVHILNFVVPGLGGGSLYGKYVKKRYNYTFTGRNLDILDLNIKYKYAFFQSRLIMSDYHDDEDNQDASKSELEKMRWAYGLGEYPEKLNPLSMEPIYQDSEDSIVKGSNQNNMTVTQQYYDYLTNPDADMMRVEMRIMGDPAFIGHDFAIPMPLSMTNKTVSSIEGAGRLGGMVFDDKLGAFNVDQAEPLVTLNFKFPRDFNEQSGFYSTKNKDNAQFSGLYKVAKVESIFDQGQFTQDLLMVRFKNQTGTVKDTQFEVKETKDKPTGTVGPWSMR